MKQPSKLMPKYSPPEKENSFMAWGFMFFIVGLLIWVSWESPFLFVVFLVIAVWTYLESIRRKKKFNALAKDRQELSICEFSHSFDCRLIDTWVIRAVYEQIQNYVSTKHLPLPIKAEDNLWDVLEIDEEDMDLDLLKEILQRTGRSIENTENNPYFDKVNTVRDLVYFINEQSLIEK